MDPSKRMARPAGDYISRGLDPASVPQARLQKEAELFYKAPGQSVPNNTMVGRGIQQEVGQDNSLVYGNLYGDWRGQGVPSTGVDLQLVQPVWQQGRMMAGNPEIDNELADRVEGERFAAQQLPSPLDQQPSELITNPGIAGEVNRWPVSGQPMGVELPSGPPVEIEDLRFTQPIIEGSMQDALFPAVEAPTFDLNKGAPARTPKAKRR